MMMTPELITEGAVVLSADDIQPEQVDWLWRRRLPRGMITLLMGDPGLGVAPSYVVDR